METTNIKAEDFCLASAEKENVCLKEYNVCLREYEGVIRSTALIDPQGLTRRFWPKAKTKGHTAEVLTELEKFT